MESPSFAVRCWLLVHRLSGKAEYGVAGQCLNRDSSVQAHDILRLALNIMIFFISANSELSRLMTVPDFLFQPIASRPRNHYLRVADKPPVSRTKRQQYR